MHFNYTSGINYWAGKIDFDYIPNTKHYVKFGIGDIYHSFKPGVSTNKQSELDTTTFERSFEQSDLSAHEFYAYLEDDFKINPRLKVNAGIHFSGFNTLGKIYTSIQPRFSSRYTLKENWSFKASYASMTQFIHLLTNSTIGLPTDLWLPVTDRVPPQNAWQTALGVAHTLNNTYEINFEFFYKQMKNLIEYKDGASFFGVDKDWQDKIESGKGWAYGAELFLKKKFGATTGWLGYTLGWTERQFDNLNNGKNFPYRYDRRHDVSLVLTHKFRENLDVGLVWVYGTGNSISLPIASYSGLPSANPWVTDTSIEHYESRNGFRMQAYHRLDLGVNMHKEKKWGKRTWNIGLYNAYSRQNPFFLYFKNQYNKTTDTYTKKLMQFSLFPIIPSVSYGFKF